MTPLRQRLASKREALADDGHQHVDRHGNPDLGLHSVLAGPVEGLDSEVLLDPLEEQFHLPSRFVDLCDGDCRKREVVGEELESLPCFHVEIADRDAGRPGTRWPNRWRSG